MPFFLALFIIVPVVEMYILIQVGSLIGGLYTIGLVLLTAMIGVSLLKRQGLSIFLTAQQKMQTGQMPVREIAEGLMLAIAGALLLTPGFVTDTIGFILLTPYLRQYLAQCLFNIWLKNSAQAQFYQQTHYYSRESASHRADRFDPDQHEPSSSSSVIEGEFQQVSDEKIEKK
jgi:UPF0716 protein FxsA